MYCISGYKLDDCTGAPLQGWNITLRNSTHNVSQLTNPDGKYQFCNLKPGDYTLTEEARPGYLAVKVVSNPVELNCSNVTNQNFSNQKLLCISGHKYNNCTRSPLPGWLIEVFNSSTGSKVGQNVTNDTGFWSVCNLVPGNYRVTETLKPNWKNVTALSQTVALGCTNRTGIDFYNDPLLCISGTKFNNCTKLGLDGWTVIVKNSTGVEVGRNTTVGGGKWSVCNLLPGTYTVTETLKPLWKNVTALTQTVVLGCDNRTGIDFYNDPLLCISGTKFNNCTKQGLDGWTVIVKNSTGVEVGRNITVGGGKWSVCNLLPGTYTVTETLKPLWKNVTALTQTVVLGCD